MANLIKLKAVKEKTALSTSTIYRGIERGSFPKPIPLTPNGRAVAWLESEVDQWIEQRIEAARQEKGAA
ncbi:MULTISPECIES: helix-turn-helix transcriptional regulator [Halomonadaceae]|uniref:helix-turn-helix transcriptional regulator n=1 Tax=Halomonadaceae TaxID=28256 RepID=UPI000C3492DA|nr:AlpA family transcriptional regulator [Halomonas sp. MES3-P3E]PKG49289.1 AlpA family transcriptional regulator [Halomonas sp. MES3-P3E]